MSVIKEINHRGYTAEICLDTDAQNPLEFSSWRIHIFGNENILLGDSVDEALNLEHEEASSDFELVDILTRMAGKEGLKKYSIQECADLIKEQGKYLVYFLRVKSFVQSDPLMVELHTAPANLVHDFCDGIIYIDIDSLDAGGLYYHPGDYEETLEGNKEMAQAVLNEWLAFQNNEMLCTYISDSDGDNVEILGGLLSLDEAIDESIRLIDELRDRELEQLAKTNPEAAVISLVRERGIKRQSELVCTYTHNVKEVEETLQLLPCWGLKPGILHNNLWEEFNIGSGFVVVQVSKTEIKALQELTTALTTNFTTYQKEDDE